MYNSTEFLILLILILHFIPYKNPYILINCGYRLKSEGRSIRSLQTHVPYFKFCVQLSARLLQHQNMKSLSLSSLHRRVYTSLSTSKFCVCAHCGLTSFSLCLTQLGCVYLSLRCLNSAVFVI